MTTAAMLSTPVYRPVLPPLPAQHRLLVVQHLALPETAYWQQQLGEEGVPVSLISLNADMEQLFGSLQQHLSQARVGTRLYICGDESFLWKVHQQARQCGLLNGEIELIRTGDSRELYCVHCSTLQTIEPAPLVHCRQCGLQLMVREHFSQRLGAYMGVCNDPFAPYGETPATVASTSLEEQAS